MLTFVSKALQVCKRWAIQAFRLMAMALGRSAALRDKKTGKPTTDRAALHDKKTGKPATDSAMSKLGPRHSEPKQAPALSKAMWRKWLEFVLARAGPRIFLVIWLTGEFGLRVREALALQRGDLRTEADPPYVDVRGVIAGARKSPGRVYIRPASLRQLRDFFAKGVPVAPKVRRCRDHGQGNKSGQQKRPFKEQADKRQKADSAKGGTAWQVPKSGFLFAARTKSKRKHLHYNAVWNQCKKLAPLFQKELEKDGACCDQDVARVRPHSGRATFITQLMSEGIITAVSMKCARHKPGSIKTHLRYGQLTLEDLRQALDKTASPGARCTQLVRVRGGVLREASQADLRAARKAIKEELARRGAV